MENLVHVDLYTDGACSQNGTWVGGFGAVLISGENRKEINGVRENTTNNQMELLAVIEGVKCLKKQVDLTIYTDSAYVFNAFSQNWIETWKNSGWKNSQNKPVANREMWEELIELLKVHQVSWEKVKGHADNENNNRCDYLATSAISEFEKKKKDSK